MVGAGLHGEDHEQNLHWSSFTEAAVRHVPCNQSNEAGAPGEQVSKEASGRSFRIAAGGDPGCGSARQPSSRKIERIHSRSVCKHLASRRLQCMAPNLLTLSRMTRGAHPVDVIEHHVDPAGNEIENPVATFDYFEATRAYLERYGKPIAFYSDKHAVFRVNWPPLPWPPSARPPLVDSRVERGNRYWTALPS
jgi:hypothetical protein